MIDQKDVDSGAVADRLDQAEDVAREFGVHETPAFLIARTGEEIHVLEVARPSDPAPFAQAIDALLTAR